MALEDFVDLKLDHHTKDGIEIVDVEGEIDVYTAPRLRELLIELVNTGFYQLVVNMEKVEFLDSTGLGVLVGGLKRVRAHDGSLDLVCTQERILKIFRITGLTKVFGIHDTVDEAITARKAEKQPAARAPRWPQVKLGSGPCPPPCAPRAWSPRPWPGAAVWTKHCWTRCGWPSARRAHARSKRTACTARASRSASR